MFPSQLLTESCGDEDANKSLQTCFESCMDDVDIPPPNDPDCTKIQSDICTCGETCSAKEDAGCRSKLNGMVTCMMSMDHIACPSTCPGLEVPSDLEGAAAVA